ncbi:MAG: Ig-like domain-containing protein [Chloroflexota bacterium]|nr:Ig-like domain-containing protein [Chloroflexota bacterium]
MTIVIAGVMQSRHATASGDCTADASIDAEEQSFLGLINNYRAQNGLSPLALSYTLSKSASWKSMDMAVNNYYAHDDLTRTWTQRLKDCGYTYNAWLGEAIDAGRPDVGGGLSVFTEWKNSPEHNAIMLGANYTAIGIGRAYYAGAPYNWYWTTDFGSYSDGWPAVTPTATSTQSAPSLTGTPSATQVSPTATDSPVASPTATVATPTSVPDTTPPLVTDTPAASPTATVAAPTSVPDTTPPLVTLVSPSAGGAYEGKVAVAASASDNGGVARVEFYVDGVLYRTDSRAPYSTSWNLRPVTPGSHTVTARAVDVAGNTATDSVTITTS